MPSLPLTSVCIATYRRAPRLALLLADLAAQTHQPAQIVVVDNDAQASARPVVEAFARDMAQRLPELEVCYDVQPERNISLTRNRTVARATAPWLAFIDDDERAPPEWLARLHALAQQTGADGVLGPVLPEVPAEAPVWIRRGDFYSFDRFATGQDVPLNALRFGNVLLRAAPVRAQPGPFDPAFALATGEDADLLIRLIRGGARIIWHDEAPVIEPVEPARLSLRWLLQRAHSGGQEYARKALTGCYGPMNAWGRLRLAADAALKAALALILAVLSLPLGRHRAAHWLLRARANVGKLSAFGGQRYQEYARAAADPTPPAPQADSR